MMKTKCLDVTFALLVAVAASCRHAPEPGESKTYPVCCTEAIPATNRINLPPGIFTVQTKGDKTISANGGRDWRAAWHQA
jgi:hypothetical protein